MFSATHSSRQYLRRSFEHCPFAFSLELAHEEMSHTNRLLHEEWKACAQGGERSIAALLLQAARYDSRQKPWNTECVVHVHGKDARLGESCYKQESIDIHASGTDRL